MIVGCPVIILILNLFSRYVINEDMNVLSGSRIMYSGMQYLVMTFSIRVSPTSYLA